MAPPNTTSEQPPKPRRAPRPSRPKGMGQWALATAIRSTPTSASSRTTTASTSETESRTSIQAGIRQHRPRRPARPYALVGLYTQREPGIDGGKTRHWSPRNSTTSTSCCGCAATADSSAWPTAHESCRHRRGLRVATPLTSPIARTSNTTGSRSRTSPKSGDAWSRSDSVQPRHVATPLASCSARRSRGSRPTRSSTPHPP